MMTRLTVEEGVSREIAQAFAEQLTTEGIQNVYHSTMRIDSIQDKPTLLGGCPACGKQDCVALSCQRTLEEKSLLTIGVLPTVLCKTCKHTNSKGHVPPCSECTEPTIGQHYSPVVPQRIKL